MSIHYLRNIGCSSYALSHEACKPNELDKTLPHPTSPSMGKSETILRIAVATKMKFSMTTTKTKVTIAILVMEKLPAPLTATYNTGNFEDLRDLRRCQNSSINSSHNNNKESSPKLAKMQDQKLVQGFRV